MAQAFARLGSRVSLFEREDHILPREDIAAAKIVQQQMERDGVCTHAQQQRHESP